MTHPSRPLERAHRNRQLFSNHFLDQRLPSEDRWTSVAAEADRAWRELRELYDAQEAALAGANEAQTEERWIKPVLHAGVREIGDFGGLPVFPDATVRAAVVVAERGASPGEVMSS